MKESKIIEKDKKIKVKKVKKKILRLADGNFSLTLFIVLMIIVILSPLLLNISSFYAIVSKMLYPLKTTDYKSAYIQMLGAMLGSFLAITGALWIQNLKAKHDRINIIKESALIVYYDFKFMFDELYEFFNWYTNLFESVNSNNCNLEEFKKFKRRLHNMYLDLDWIKNVAKLHEAVDKDVIEEIYNMYGILTTIIKIFQKDDTEINEVDTIKVNRLLHTKIFYFPEVGRVKTIELRKENSELLDKLYKLI